MSDYKEDWDYYDSMPRKDVLNLAMEEMLDVRGLSKVKEILYKYNLSTVTFDYKLQITFKKSLTYCPRRNEQGKA